MCVITDGNHVVQFISLIPEQGHEGDQLRTIFQDGRLLVKDSLATIRERLLSNL